MSKASTQKAVMVSTGEAAAMFSVAGGTLQNWRSQKKGPKFFRVRRKVLYRVDDLEDFFTSTPVLTLDSLPEAR